MKIGHGFLDDDLYKIKVCYAISELYPDVVAEFRFINRGKHKFSQEFYSALCNQLFGPDNNIEFYSHKTSEEINWLAKTLPEIKESFWTWLRDFKYDSKAITLFWNTSGNLDITIKGLWKEVTMWEIKLLYIISNIYYQCLPDFNWKGYNKRLIEKRHNLYINQPIHLVDFGTRRRASFEVQEDVVLSLHSLIHGTSNMKIAMKNNIPVSGTMPHEWIMGISVLEGLRHANRFALQKWADVFPDPGIALSDTYGIDAFFSDFNVRLAKLYDGTRQDSGNPIEYVNRIIEHYRRIGVNPLNKKIVFSDSLNFFKAFDIAAHCKGKIGASFGIGTYLSNDFEDTDPLNIVIKPYSFDNIPVVKLGEGSGKVSGDPKAIEYTKWVFGK